MVKLDGLKDLIDDQPSPLQRAISAFIANTVTVHHSRLHYFDIPTRTGKSRIIAGVAILLLKSMGFDKVVVITASKQLANRDDSDLSAYYEVTGFRSNVSYASALPS